MPPRIAARRRCGTARPSARCRRARRAARSRSCALTTISGGGGRGGRRRLQQRASSERDHSWRSASIGLSAGGPARREIAEHDADQRREEEGEQVDPGIEHERHVRAPRTARAQAISASTSPISPPRHDSTTASTRNCSITSRATAPIARRMPISRVRSVTETSMMFMIPIPPTSSEIAATAPTMRGQDAGDAGQRVGDLAAVEDGEVVELAAGDVAPLAQQRGDRFLDVGAVIGGIGRDDDRADVAVAGEAALHRLDRHQHGIVVILPEAALRRASPARRSPSQLTLPSRSARADRRLGRIEILLHRVADQADRLARLLLGIGEAAAVRRPSSPARRDRRRWCR